MTRHEIPPKIAEALGWTELLGRLAELCQTVPGQERARALPLLPDEDSVNRELAEVAEARTLHDRGDPPPFGTIFDLRLPLKRLEKEGVLEGPTLCQVAETLRSGARLSRFLRDRGDELPRLGTIAARIAPLDGVSGPILEAFDEGGVLSDHASEELARLRRLLSELHDRLVKRIRGLIEQPQIAKFLQDTFYTQREDRYVLPVRTDAGPAVEGIVHGSSASGATTFVEPKEVVGLNNELKVAEIAVRREEARILAELSALVGEEWQTIESNLEQLERLDLIDARARLAGKLSAHQPRISSSGKIQLHAMRHPLMVLAGSTVVPNDVELEAGRALIVSGPNAGGKTVCLKSIGLCALMLRAGMHLPAGPDSELPFHGTVLAELGDDQSIERSLSTFTAHLTHLQAFLDQADVGTLVLLDEIAVGTDPGEGAALAQAVLEGIVETGAQVVVTTHYERLKTLALADRRFANGSVGFDLQRMSPTYRLHLGLPGSSGALAVAKRLGLPARIVERAAGLLERGGQALAELLTALSGERTRLEEERRGLEAQKLEAQGLVAKQRAVLDSIRERERQAVQGVFKGAVEELVRARAELERVRTQLRRPPSPERLQQAERQISAAAGTIRSHEPRAGELDGGRRPSPEELRPGVQVLCPSLRGIGEVIEAPQRGRVLVRVGKVRAQVALEELRFPDAEQRAAARAEQKELARRERTESAERPGPAAAGQRLTPIRTEAITLHLRGLRVDEAIGEVDKFLDRAIGAGEPVLFLIHGHGTGALRTALRSHLAASPLVDRTHPAEPKEGGDGVTVVWLKD
jgi:DNA mismatch repair protein MutS2